MPPCPAAQNQAKAVRIGCPVRTECLAHVLDRRIEHGVWGGMTERERPALLRRRPTVTSWRLLWQAARAEYGRQDAACREPDGSPSQAG
ncbi:WhiB family transcriptional regulator [Streptomyces sp. NPDC054804]